LGAPTPPQVKNDEYFGKQEVYHNDSSVGCPRRSAGGAVELPATLPYQWRADAVSVITGYKNFQSKSPCRRRILCCAGSSGSSTASTTAECAVRANPAHQQRNLARSKRALIDSRRQLLAVLYFLWHRRASAFTPCVLRDPILSASLSAKVRR